MLRLSQNAPYNGIGFDEQETSNGVLNESQWYHQRQLKMEIAEDYILMV